MEVVPEKEGELRASLRIQVGFWPGQLSKVIVNSGFDIVRTVP